MAIDTGIQRLLSQSGGSLEEMRELYPKLTAAIKKPATAFPTEPTFYTPTEAEQFGVALEEGWMLKVTPAEGGYAWSLLSPDKWEITQDEQYISPTGETFTREQLEASYMPEPSRPLTPSDWAAAKEPTAPLTPSDWAAAMDLTQAPSFEEMTVALEAAYPGQEVGDIIDYIMGSPAAFVEDLRIIGRTPETENLLKALVPGIKEWELRRYFGQVSETMADKLWELPLGSYSLRVQDQEDIRRFRQQDFFGCIEAIVFESYQPGGLEWAREQLLRLGYDDAGVDSLLHQDLLGKIVTGDWLPEPVEDYWSAFFAGTGDMLGSLSGLAHKIGAQSLEERLEGAGLTGRLISYGMDPGEPYSAEWFGENMARMAPAMMVLIAIGLGTGGVGSAAVLKAGGGKLLAGIVGSIVAGLTSTTAEGLLEASAAYNEAINRGMTEAEADTVFNQVLRGNFGLLSVTNTAQFATAFLPGGRSARFIAKALMFGFDVVSEGIEEGGQLMITRGALGDVQEWDAEMWQNISLGMAGGLGFGSVAQIYQRIKGDVYSQMTPGQIDSLSRTIIEYETQGYSSVEAEAMGWEWFASTTEGSELITTTVDTIMEQERQQALSHLEEMHDAMNEIDARLQQEGVPFIYSENVSSLAWERIEAGIRREQTGALSELHSSNPDLTLPVGGDAGLGVLDVGQLMDDSSPEALLTVPSNEDIIKGILVPNWIRTTLKATGKIPGIGRLQRKVFGWRHMIDPNSEFTEDIVARVATVHGVVERMGQNGSRWVVASLRSIIDNPVKFFAFDNVGYSEKMAKRLLPEYGIEAPYAGSLEHVFTHHEMYDWTKLDPALRYITEVNAINDAVLAMLRAEGVPPKIVLDAWMHRVVTGKTVEGVVIEVRGQPGKTGKRVGAKPSYEKPRTFATMIEGIAAGIQYDPNIEVSIGTYIEEAMKRIAGERVTAMVAEFGITPGELLEQRYPGVTERANETKVDLADAALLHALALRAKRGEKLTEQTLRAVERRFPDLGRRLRALVFEKSDTARSVRRMMEGNARRIQELEAELAEARQVPERKPTEPVKKVERVAPPEPVEITDEQAMRDGFRVLDPEVRAGLRESGEDTLQSFEQMVDEEEGLLEEMIEDFENDRARPFIDIVAKTGEYRGEIMYLTVTQYRLLTGGKWITQTMEKMGKKVTKRVLSGGKTPKPSIMTPDGKKVRWEYAMDEVAQELGYESDEALKQGIEAALHTKRRIDDLKAAVAHDNARLNGIKRMLSILENIEANPRFIEPGEPTTLAMAEWGGMFGEGMAEVPAKEPWQMTREEYVESERLLLRRREGRIEPLAENVRQNILGEHRGYIQQALSEGKPVPAEVLADYPDLAPEVAPEIATGKPYTATVYKGSKPGEPPVDAGLFGTGHYCTTNEEYADTYGTVEVTVVRLQNPFVINSMEEAEAFWNETTRPTRQEAIADGKTPKEADDLAAEVARGYLERQGYDGVIARDIIAPGDEIVVFYPEKALAKPEVAPLVPEAPAEQTFTGWHTPIIEGKQELADLQSAGLPTGRFIALDKPFVSAAHDATKATEETITVKSVYDPDGLLGTPSPELHTEFADYVNREIVKGQKPMALMRETREAFNEFLRARGYDSYIRAIDGDRTNRELIYLGEPTGVPIAPDFGEIPVAPPGMPEAGLQRDIFGFAVPVEPKGKGEITQISMEDYNALIEHYKEAGLPMPHAQVKPKIEGIPELTEETQVRQRKPPPPPPPSKTDLNAEFDDLIREAKALMESRKAPYWQAKSERARKMDIVRAGEIDLGYLPMPFAGGKMYNQDFIDACNKFFGIDKGSGVLSFTSDAAGILRITKAALDFSAPAIQGLPAFGLAHSMLLKHPVIGAKLMGRWYKALLFSTASFFNPGVFYAYAAKNKQLGLQMISFGASMKSIDYFEALKRKHGLGKIGAWVLGHIPLDPFGRAEMAFFSFGQIVRTEFWKALSPKAIEQGKAFELARFLDIMTGIANAEATGVPLTVRQLESSFMWFAPNYTRACLSLVGDIFRGGYTGAKAREALGGLIMALPLYYMGIQLAMSALSGESDDEALQKVEEGLGIRTDPITGEVTWRPKSDFLGLKIGNYTFAPGGFWYGLVRLVGNINDCIDEVGQKERIDLVRILQYGRLNKDNPFVYWWFCRSSPLLGFGYEMATHKDFLGYPIETPAEYAQYILTRFEPIWMEQGINWMIPGLQRDYEIPEGAARKALIPFELFGWRSVPESFWVKFYDMANEYIGQLPRSELEQKQVAAWEAGKLGWGQLTKKQKQDLIERYPELADLYEMAQNDSKMRQSPEWEAYTMRVDEERGIYQDRINEYSRRLLEGEIDTREYREFCSEAGQNYGAIMEALSRDPTYSAIFEYFEKKDAEGSKYEFRWDMALAEYETQIRFADDPGIYLPNGDYNWDERDRRIDAFIEQWGLELYNEIRDYVSTGKEIKGLNPLWVRRGEDTEKLGRGYWRLPYQALMDMTQEDYDEGSIPAEHQALWRQYNALPDEDKEAFIEAHPEIEKDWRAEYRRANPEADAMLALWGYGGKLQSMDAYNLAKQCGQELGIPLSQMGLGLPPETLIEDYFGYGTLTQEVSGNSAEAKLWRLENPEFTNWAMENWGWEGTEDYKGMEYYKLQIKWRPEQAEYDAIETTEARQDYLDAHPEFRDDRRRMEAWGYGIDDAYVELYVEYYSLPGAGYDQERFLMEHEDYYNDVWLGTLENEPKDFDKIPTEKEERLLSYYDDLPSGTPRLQARCKDADLDAALVRMRGLKPAYGTSRCGVGVETEEATPWEEYAAVKAFQDLFP